MFREVSETPFDVLFFLFVAADRLRGAAAETRAQRRPPAHAEAHRVQVRHAPHLQVGIFIDMIFLRTKFYSSFTTCDIFD